MSKHRVFIRKPRGRVMMADIDLQGASEDLRSAVAQFLQALAREERPSGKAPNGLLRYERDVFCRIAREVLRLHDKGEINQCTVFSKPDKAVQPRQGWSGDDVSEKVMSHIWKLVITGKRIDEDLLETLSPETVSYLVCVAEEYENTAFREQARRVVTIAESPLAKPKFRPAPSWKEVYVLRKRNRGFGSSGGVHTVRGRLH